MADPFSDDYDQAEPHEEQPKYRAADFPKQNLANSSQFRTAVRHISNIHEAGTPEEHQAGSEWYPKVHDATAKGAKLLNVPHLSAAGMVAAVSPAMDWERNNIGAFHEMSHLGGAQWDAIHHSATQSAAGPYHRRTQEATDALRGMSISTATDSGLLKAHRLLQGEHVDTVMPARTSPKTNSFAHAIHDPEGHGLTTIDGRAHDIGQNEQWPWEYTGRGISSADLPSSRRILKSGQPAKSFGKRTRYEQFSDAYHTAAQAADIHPNAMQARTWLTGKRLERSVPTQSGAPRVKGAPRKRQPYL